MYLRVRLVRKTTTSVKEKLCCHREHNYGKTPPMPSVSLAMLPLMMVSKRACQATEAPMMERVVSRPVHRTQKAPLTKPPSGRLQLEMNHQQSVPCPRCGPPRCRTTWSGTSNRQNCHRHHFPAPPVRSPRR